MDNKVELTGYQAKRQQEHLSINKDTLHRWIKNKSIPCHRVGRLWKFKISEIDEWLKGNGGGANADKNKGLNNMATFGDT